MSEFYRDEHHPDNKTIPLYQLLKSELNKPNIIKQSNNIETINTLGNEIKKTEDNLTSVNTLTNMRGNNKSNTSGKPEACKICYEGRSEANVLLNPCLCEGSMKYIHLNCLKTWITKQHGNPEEAFCEICKYKYTMKYKTKKMFSKIKCYAYTEKFLTLIAAVAIILGIVSVIFYTIYTR